MSQTETKVSPPDTPAAAHNVALPAWVTPYLAHLSTSFHKTDAARAAGVDLVTVLELRLSSPAFAAAEGRVISAYADILEAEALRRVTATRTRGDKTQSPIGSDTLLLRLMERFIPGFSKKSRSSPASAAVPACAPAPAVAAPVAPASTSRAVGAAGSPPLSSQASASPAKTSGLAATKAPAPAPSPAFAAIPASVTPPAAHCPEKPPADSVASPRCTPVVQSPSPAPRSPLISHPVPESGTGPKIEPPPAQPATKCTLSSLQAPQSAPALSDVAEIREGVVALQREIALLARELECDDAGPENESGPNEGREPCSGQIPSNSGGRCLPRAAILEAVQTATQPPSAAQSASLDDTASPTRSTARVAAGFKPPELACAHPP